MVCLTNLCTKYPPMLPKLNRRRALVVLGKIDEILAWEARHENERDTRFVELGKYLCEVRAGQYWRLEKLKSFDEFLERRFPESRRKAYYLMSIHEQLPPQVRKELKQVGWTKGVELAKLARKQGQRFESATWLHKARQMPKAEFQREVEKELTGKDSEPSELIYFKVYKSQIPVIEQAIEAAGLMLGSDKSRGYCLEMICADFLAGASIEGDNPEILLQSLSRYYNFLPGPQQQVFLSEISRDRFMKQVSGKSRRLRLDAKSYRALHRQVLERDGWRCQVCGRMQNLQVHHLEFRSQSGSDCAIQQRIVSCSRQRSIRRRIRLVSSDTAMLILPTFPCWSAARRCGSLRLEPSIGLCVRPMASESARSRRSDPTPVQRHRLRSAQKFPPKNASGNGNGSGHQVRDRLCQIIRQHTLDPELVKAYAVDFCGPKLSKTPAASRSKALFSSWPRQPRKTALPCSASSTATHAPVRRWQDEASNSRTRGHGS